MKTVLTNGCLDLLHDGHLALLARCRHLSEGGLVVVALNTDESVSRLKPGRPVRPFASRRNLLLALRTVDVVWGFDSERDLMEVIEYWKPDFLVKGPGTPSQAKIDLLAQWGGQYIRMEGTDDSTTAIIEKIRAGL